MAREQDIENKLVAYICRNYMVDPDEFSYTESLVDQGVIDSFGLVEISAFMEKEFHVKVETAEMNRGNFGSLKLMAAYVCGKGPS